MNNNGFRILYSGDLHLGGLFARRQGETPCSS